jgi:NADH dehydrogenase
MKLLVTGGNGFIGRQVCRLAVEAGHQVVSLARGGRPRGAEPWMEGVQWLMTDVFYPHSWNRHLADTDAVVHCIGIIRQRPSRGVTFERLNGDSAILVAREAEQAGVGSFVMLSASAKPLLISLDYIDAKRRAEAEVSAIRGLRSVFLRPGLVHGPGRRVPPPLLHFIDWAATREHLDRLFLDFRPLPVEVVAGACLRAALDPGFVGVLDIDQIRKLGR